VIAVGEDPASALHQAVEGACDSDLEALHASSENTAIVCFDDQVNVIAQHREVNEACIFVQACGFAQRALDGAKPARGTQVPDAFAKSECHVRRLALGQ